MAGVGLDWPGFPLAAVIAGVPVVTIPTADYARLLRESEELAAIRAQPAPPTRLRPPHSPIDRDPEVATFIVSRAGIAFIKDILAECHEMFGASRTPSRSAAHRFIHRARLASRASAATRRFPRDTG